MTIVKADLKRDAREILVDIKEGRNARYDISTARCHEISRLFKGELEVKGYSDVVVKDG